MKFNLEQKIITKSNENEPFKIGTVVGYNEEIKSSDDIPLVKIDGEDFLVFGITVPYSEELEKRLNSLIPKQQYELLWAIRENDTGKRFYIMHGLPGSGKSTKAHLLAGQQGRVFSADDYHVMVGNGKYDWKPENVGKAHSWNQKRALAAFDANVSIIVIDNTNTTLKEMRAYLPHIKQAMELGYKVSIEEPDTEWAFDIEECFKRGTHNVPKVTLQKMYDRYVHNVDVEHVLFNM